jgi:hypothetical protein
MSDQESQGAQESPSITLRREVIERFGSFRVDRELLRVSASTGPWREYHLRYVLLEATPQAEFEIGGAPAAELGDLHHLLRWLRQVLERLAPALQEPDIVYGPWKQRLADTDEGYLKTRPTIGVVSRYKAAALIANALDALERAHPEPQDDQATTPDQH